MQNGIVKTYRPDRGFAFLTADGGGEAFCPASTITRSGIVELKDGDRIRFDSRPDRRGGTLPFVFFLETA